MEIGTATEPNADVNRSKTATTRRAVVRTGIKLAYVAPVVAASFRVHGASAGFVGVPVSPACPDGSCGAVGPGEEPECDTDDLSCLCFATNAGCGFCAAEAICVDLTDCSADPGACGPGTACSSVSGCVDPDTGAAVSVCLPACGATILSIASLSDAADPQCPNGGRWTTHRRCI